MHGLYSLILALRHELLFPSTQTNCRLVGVHKEPLGTSQVAPYSHLFQTYTHQLRKYLFSVPQYLINFFTEINNHFHV